MSEQPAIYSLNQADRPERGWTADDIATLSSDEIQQIERRSIALYLKRIAPQQPTEVQQFCLQIARVIQEGIYR